MAQAEILQIIPLPMVTKDGSQRVDMAYASAAAQHLVLAVFRDGEAIIRRPAALSSGKGTLILELPVQEETFDALWQLEDREGRVLSCLWVPWVKPRERTMYVMLSSHTDIGLHNSQYIQRHNSCRFLDMAKELCDATDHCDEENRYRYVMEGTWFWNNYGQDRGEDAAREVVQNYIKKGKLGVCCGIAGNHTQTYGLEELCRSTYERRRLEEDWGISTHTLAMIDNNGMTMAMISPWAQAGIEHIIFAPNHWNPLPSTIWKADLSKEGVSLNPDAGGGGSRIDIRYGSELPMVFFWEAEDGSRVLVWGSTQYGYGGASFGLFPRRKFVPETLPLMEECMARQLPRLEDKYPYDVWLMCCYDDDQDPDMEVTRSIQAWNSKWAWPKLRTLGDPDEPFRILKERHAAEIPVLRGDITGGWYQHPLSVPELMAQKYEADRLLPTAEKWASVAALLDENYEYPSTAFRQAWDHLLFNDEHSYGTSGYQGRRVYETWMQHRDWIDKALSAAREESSAALKTIAARIRARENSLAVFNPTAHDRRECIVTPEGKYTLADIPSFGYRVVPEHLLEPLREQTEAVSLPPVIENRYYRIRFGENGTLRSIYDKELCREILDTGSPFGGNELIYTRDNHRSFLVPQKASFRVTRNGHSVSVSVMAALPELGAEILQTVTLPDWDKRIDIDNRLTHVTDMVNKRRYLRYLYFAFPFAVEQCRRYCHLNGCVAEYAKDVTGHGTDVYMAASEWCCAENSQWGAALVMPDSQLVEFDRIHPDKTDFGNTGDSSRMFAYVANDWLQMHTPGGSHLDYRFRFTVTSYRGTRKSAGVARLAERLTHPVQPVSIPPQSGDLDGTAHSFLKLTEGQRLLTLKRADDGRGLIARLYGSKETFFETGFPKAMEVRRVSVDERETESSSYPFTTYRLEGVNLQPRPEHPDGNGGLPAPIGSVYTGLITQPCAAAGENKGHLYLLWGQNREEDFSHYHLFRSETPGFTPDEKTFLAKVSPEEYRVGRYEDTGLKEHTAYYYRVCAVNRSGKQGPFSREFMGITRESI